MMLASWLFEDLRYRLCRVAHEAEQGFAQVGQDDVADRKGGAHRLLPLFGGSR
jgi:hypothetical protein